jgi:hypothetical protein
MTYTIKHQPSAKAPKWAVYDQDHNCVYRCDEQEECEWWIELAEMEAEE